MSGLDDEVDEYVRLAQHARKRFRRILVGAMVGLLGLLYAPWALVPSGLLSSGTAQGVSILDGILVLGVWYAVLGRIADPRDSPEPNDASRYAYFKLLMLIAASILGIIVAFCGLSVSFGLIGLQGLGATVLLLAVLGMMLARALISRAIRSAF
jgi:hypothetical protein